MTGSESRKEFKVYMNYGLVYECRGKMSCVMYIGRGQINSGAAADSGGYPFLCFLIFV